MERREWLGGIGALAAVALTGGNANAQADKAAAKGKAPAAAAGGHHHHGASAETEVFIDSLSDCINKGEACLAHCLILLGDGDKSLAGCARSVSETLALCEGTRKLVAQGSKRAKEMARIARAACLDCEKECRKHEKKHAECRNCAEACASCAKECEKFAA